MGVPTLLADPAGVLTAVNYVKQNINVESGFTDDDDLITDIAQAVYEAMEARCARLFLKAERTEYYDGRGSNKLLLKCRPVDTDAAFSIWDDIDRAWSSDDLLDSDDYEIQADAGIVVTDGFPFANGNGQRNVKVTYTAGWAVTSTDSGFALFKRACFAWIQAEYLKVAGGGHGVKDGTAGPSRVTWSDELPLITKTAIARLQNPDRFIA